MIDWDKLRIFHTVAKKGSCSAAANDLSTSQSAISRQVSMLEESLGVLFARHPRGLRLTSNGQFLYEVTKDVAQKIAKIEEFIQDNVEKVEGTIRVLTSEIVALTLLPVYLKGFTKKYPHLHVEIIESGYEVDSIKKENDVAILLSWPADSDFEHFYLTTLHMQMFASRNYIGKYGMPQSVDDLKNHHMIGYTADFGMPFSNINWNLHLNRNKLIPIMETNSIKSGYNLAQNGYGIVSLPREYVDICDHNLVPVLEKYHHDVDVFYIYPKDKRYVKAARVLGEHITEAMENSKG